MSGVDAWAGMHRVCVAQEVEYVREYAPGLIRSVREFTPDEARQFAHRLLWLADVADGNAAAGGSQ
jgi:hypothetical protein